jgi:MFS transporter, putative metabolite transport protein
VSPQIPYDAAPPGRFHARVAIAATGGVFSDGYGLGIVGLALTGAQPQLGLTPTWLGALGGAALLGLFLGALATGPIADRGGRRRVFAWNMGALLVLSLAQFYVQTALQLWLLRLLIGLLLGSDYVVSKALLSELLPSAIRTRALSRLAIAWAVGYAMAYLAGFLLRDSGANAWRLMLATSALPCLLVLPLRLRTPESPVWLTARDRGAEAQAIIARHLGTSVRAPERVPQVIRNTHPWRQLLAAPLRARTLAACTLFTGQVIPYFALGTFVSRVLAALHVTSNQGGGLVYNGSLLVGAIAGQWVVHRLPRRAFMIGSFTITAAALLPLALSDQVWASITVVLFAVFASVLSASTSLVYVYLPELFPAELRASGIGLAIATSRIGSAVSTFFLPLVVAHLGIHAALGLCTAVLGASAAVLFLIAPETRTQSP